MTDTTVRIAHVLDNHGSDYTIVRRTGVVVATVAEVHTDGTVSRSQTELRTVRETLEWLGY